MNSFKVNTPYARVTVTVDDEDMWAYEDIMNWVLEELNGASPRTLDAFNQKIDNMINLLKEKE